jgi:hypothetical protein
MSRHPGEEHAHGHVGDEAISKRIGQESLELGFERCVVALQWLCDVIQQTPIDLHRRCRIRTQLDAATRWNASNL